jgi:hypothetical protein
MIMYNPKRKYPGRKPVFKSPLKTAKPMTVKQKSELLERFIELHRKHAAKIWAQPHTLKQSGMEALTAALSACIQKEKVEPYLDKLRSGEIFVGGDSRVSITVVPDGFLTEAECKAIESNLELSIGGTIERRVCSLSAFKKWVLETADFVAMKRFLDSQN